MNRLVIIGNGFDLAHGLPTRYKDFVDDYWKNIKDSNHNELVSFNFDNLVEFKSHNNLDELITAILKINNKYRNEGVEVYKLKEQLVPLADNRIQIINYKNKFFELINHFSLNNWVDVENLYYELLKDVFKGIIKHYSGTISELNKDFEEIKNYLIKYLYKISDESDYMDRRIYGIKSILEKQYYEDLELDFYLDEFPNEDHDDLIKDNDIVKNHLFANGNLKELTKNKIVENQLYFLSFNYTPLANRYVNEVDNFDENKANYIHGLLNFEKTNPINFGFGDELNENYKEIENLNENEYLRFFKSFQYLQNSNYRNLLQFIDSKKFQVYIMGHSCGLSDRTLLNTIFEHKNCRSIKVFYYEEFDNEGDFVKDNFTEIIQNISRHFDDKKQMRAKIVNKGLSDPLPQIQLPKN